MNGLRTRVTIELQKAGKRRAVAASTRGEQMAKERQWQQLAAEGRLQDLRDRARAAKNDALSHHAECLRQFVTNVERRGGQVHYAATAEEAVAEVVAIARQAGARLAVKAKSMATEEIGLTHGLEQAGLETLETDLGEFIIQLAGDRPSHITGPAIHLSTEEIAGIFGRSLGEAVPAEPEALAALVRRVLRAKFLAADVGITGANFGVAETGSVVLVTNEGNADLTTSLPRVMITVMGLEKLVPDWARLEPLLTLLPRTGTGQNMTVYVTAITGTRRAGEVDGPEELHVVVLDAGRSRLLGSRYQDALRCMRCGACLDACPVFRQVGGHGYGSVYSGPIGVLITPLLQPSAEADELLDLCSMCGACTETCPVQIPIHELIREQRMDRVAGVPSTGVRAPAAPLQRARVAESSSSGEQAEAALAPEGRPRSEGQPLAAPGVPARSGAAAAERWLFQLWAWAWSDAGRYRLFARVAALLSRPFSKEGYLTWFPGPLAEWGRGRDFPAPAAKPFHARWAELLQEEGEEHDR